ncbi:MAG TPA: hypothetical protein VLF14_08340 [Candidatus Binatia bacterium]|nr:hypothetical protein [Candidatus Binatia bacterium]
MQTKVVARVGRHGKPEAALRCPDCGAPLVGSYGESSLHELELVLSCSADCGYSRKPPRIEVWTSSSRQLVNGESHQLV